MVVAALVWTLGTGAAAEEPYRDPPAAVAAILDRPSAPGVQFSPDNTWMLEQERPGLPPLAELAEPMVRLAGLRIHPGTNGRARQSSWTGLVFRPVGRHDRVPRTQVELPPEARVNFVQWDDAGAHVAFTLTRPEGVELWVVDTGSPTPRQLVGPVLNAADGGPCRWLPDDAGLLCKVVPADRGPAPEPPAVPQGPRVSENLGREAPGRTWQDLLANAHDEALFEHYLTSELVHVGLDGSTRRVVPAGLLDRVTPSPDGRYVLVQSVHRPFSYTVPASRFPARWSVWNLAEGTEVALADLPLADDVPVKFGSVRTGPRIMSWRADRPSTLYQVEALDGGDAGREVEFRDAVRTLEAPFDGDPTLLAKTTVRYGGITWGDDDTALLSEWWWATRRSIRSVIDPSAPGAAPRVLWDRSYQDRYTDPGDAVVEPGPYGRYVLRFAPDGRIYLAGDGYGPDGRHPFLDRFDLTTGKSERLWQARDPWLETVVDVLDDAGTQILTRRESQDTPRNYAQWQIGRRRPTAMLTDFPDPVPELADVRREVVHYTRADGLDLSATLYLPPGYDAKKDRALPTVFWAYPNEFKRRDDAAQVTASDNSFSRPQRTSHLFFLLHGYAILDDPLLPIVGEGDTQPNDTYVEQLVTGAEAAVDHVVAMGVADPDRLVIGGHSYGAFMVGNLLAHSDLFRAGIARSGAYNRTLTPFGFQGEDRTFWEAPDTYMTMSPFSAAHHIDEPILLLHGEDDGNSGTWPLQSERMYAALKGNGATARWVELPHEDHGYRARESAGHTLWEMFAWADTWARDAAPRATAEAAE